ncbi:hypothetical protein DTO195F2_3620 [Paecilomyces variotii]|nr:hypothetical protein DTO195F2_3620 [Paecilomyces variotii]KAJ9355268.1 hypothetical protein DTO027B9_4357 [Paecilomyces variotii]KAJ9366359.1 hypothetical protein DTO282E5_8969 [Paecilomyces variotii]
MPLPRLSANPTRIKNFIHGFQGFVIFIAWAMTVAIFTRTGSNDGRIDWYFALCWVTIPALIYLVGVPMFPRARRFGNVYAFATIDCLFTILWFSAWVCTASYVAEGKSKGESESKNSKDKTKENKTGCDAFAYGSPGKCKLATGTTIVGVVIFLAFVGTSLLSMRNVSHFRRTGTMPDTISDPTFAAQTKAAFSSNPAHDFDEEEDEFRSGRVNDAASSSRLDGDEDYALLQQSEIDDLGSHAGAGVSGAYDPTAPAPGGVMHDYDTSYGGAYGQHWAPPATSEYGH